MLRRKLVRDLLAAKWQYGAVSMMVALGVAFFIASYSSYLNLNESYLASYSLLRFEDFGLSVRGAPERVLERVASAQGVKAVEGRLVEDCSIAIPDRLSPSRESAKKLLGRLISIPVGRQSRVNCIKLLSGRLIKSETSREVLLEASFAKYHSINPGRVIEISRAGSAVRLRVVGIVQSPEYLYVVQSKQQLMAMPDIFGVMFVTRNVLGGLVGKPNQFNDFRFLVSNGADLNSVMGAVTKILAPYGEQAPVPRVDQPSHQLLRQDVEGFKSYAVLFPAFFLSVAAVAVYSLLMRMVHQQRASVGLLRSLGLSRGTIVRHYLSASILVGFVGGLAGCVLGVWFAGWVSNLYMSQLQVPVHDVVPRGFVAMNGVAIGIATCLAGSWFPARSASRISPADAMRPIAPVFGRRVAYIDRALPRLTTVYRIPFRNLLRQPKRTVSSVFGIVSAIALLMTARGLLDSTESAVDALISGSYQYELRLDLIGYRSDYSASRVRSWPGVARAEGILELPVDFVHQGRHYSAMISGQSVGTRLFRLVDEKGKPVSIPAGGAVFGQTLRDRLKLEIGDVVQAALPESLTKEDSTTRSIRVVGFCKGAIGTVAYMDRQDLGNLFRKDLELPNNPISGVIARVDPASLEEVRTRLLSLPDAGAVLSTPEIREMILRLMSTMNIFVWIMEAFGAALAFAMLFNMVTINVLERSSEVATMRTIGISRRQIAAMVTLENLLVTAVGLAIGLPFGRWFVAKFMEVAQTAEQQDLFTFDVYLKPETYWIAALTVIVVSLISQWPSLRALQSQSLAQATKERAT